MKKHEYWVYMLHCADGSYYTGVTNDLERRVQEHGNSSHRCSYTAGRLPVELVYAQQFPYILDAIAWEKHIKRWTRAKKRALIRGNEESLRYNARGQCRRRIDNLRSSMRVTLRRTQGDTTKIILSEGQCHGESDEP